MKKIMIIMFIFLFSLSSNAGSVNKALYQTMTARSYRNNYNRQINNQPIPYWQAQSNYLTRGRVYGNYSSYNNSRYKYNTSVKSARGYKW